MFVFLLQFSMCVFYNAHFFPTSDAICHRANVHAYRSAILTGRYQIRSGIYPGVFDPDDQGGQCLSHTYEISMLDFVAAVNYCVVWSCRASSEWDNDCWGSEGGGVQHWDGGKVALGETLFEIHSRNHSSLMFFWTWTPQYPIVLHKSAH